MGQIELFDIYTVYLCSTELFEIELFDHLTVYTNDRFIYKMCLEIIYIYLALNNLQWLICHKTQPNLLLRFEVWTDLSFLKMLT